MVALSDPKEREVVVKIIINLINKDNWMKKLKIKFYKINIVWYNFNVD